MDVALVVLVVFFGSKAYRDELLDRDAEIDRDCGKAYALVSLVTTDTVNTSQRRLFMAETKEKKVKIVVHEREWMARHASRAR